MMPAASRAAVHLIVLEIPASEKGNSASCRVDSFFDSVCDIYNYLEPNGVPFAAKAI